MGWRDLFGLGSSPEPGPDPSHDAAPPPAKPKRLVEGVEIPKHRSDGPRRIHIVRPEETERFHLPSDRPGVDEAGQRHPSFGAARRRGRTRSEMIGLIKGVLADGIVMPEEVKSLGAWLCANAEEDVWPVNVLAERIALIVE